MTARFRMPDAKARLLSIETTAREQHIPLAYGVSVDRWIPVSRNPAKVRVAGKRSMPELSTDDTPDLAAEVNAEEGTSGHSSPSALGADDAPFEAKVSPDAGLPPLRHNIHKPGPGGLFAPSALCGTTVGEAGSLVLHEYDYDCTVCGALAGERQ